MHMIDDWQTVAADYSYGPPKTTSKKDAQTAQHFLYCYSFVMVYGRMCYVFAEAPVDNFILTAQLKHA